MLDGPETRMLSSPDLSEGDACHIEIPEGEACPAPGPE